LEVWETLSAVVAGLCTGLIGVALARLPRSSVAPPVYALVVCGVAWAIGDLVANSASELASKQLGIALLYTGSILLPALWWMIAIRWAQEVGAELPFTAPAWTRGPLLFAGMMWLVMITNPWHGAFLTPVVAGRNEYHALWFAMAVPNYSLIVAGFAVELIVAFRTKVREVRRQAAFLIAASLVTLIGNITYVAQIAPLDLTALLLSVSGSLLLVGMAREGLFGVLPSALPLIAAEHPDGLVLVGPTGDMRFANARAHELLAPISLQQDADIAEVLADPKLRPDTSNCESRIGDEAWWQWLVAREGLMFRFVSGQARWLYVSATVVRGRRGGRRGYCLRISDLTDEKQAELHLRQTRRLDSVAALSRSVSRQLQGILAVIHGNAELLFESDDNDDARGRQIARIQEATRYGTELSQQLQLYTGTLDTTRVLLEMSEVVEESCELVESDLPAGVSLTYEGSDEVLPIHVDAVQVRHCIYNLMTNAIEAMADLDGSIRANTGVQRFDPANRDLVCGADQSAGEFAYVSIRDEGGGMEPVVEERAFEPFFSTRKKDRGSGLPTVLGIARAHGALVSLDNEYGRGCTFTLYFPLERNAGSA
jgi:signal transduction histidine kinase